MTTDQLAGSAGGAASGMPGAANQDIETITAELEKKLMAQFDERIKGFQRVIGSKDERLSAFEKELKQLKTASLGPEELEELELAEKDSRIRELESKLEMRELAGSFADEMPYFERLLEAQTAEDQLKVFREYRESLRPAATEEPPVGAAGGELEIPDVDFNRPARRAPQGVVLPDGTVMNDETADRILGSVGSAALAQFTRRR